MNRFLWVGLVLVVLGGFKASSIKAERDRRIAQGWCAEPASIKERVEAEEAGLMVDRGGCIVQPPPAAAPPAALASEDSAPAAASPASLADARQGFRTTLAGAPRPQQILPEPPAALFVRSDYASGAYPAMPAYVTPDPKDGKRHPAIIWITGGDFSSFDRFWEPGRPEADESASQFRDAGMIMMFPSLRGSANNGSRPEYFLGEVDDVLAAAAHLATLPYVDPQRIYLGGHSTGGTLALLVAETSPRFRAVFALGPVESPAGYPASIMPPLRSPDPMELKLRSPIHWLAGIGSPTYIIEGSEPPGNFDAFEGLCRNTVNPFVHCVSGRGLNHFSVIAPAARVIAARLAIEVEGLPFSLRSDDIVAGAPR